MPTATDRDFLDMPVSDVRLVTRFGRDQHVVLLQEPQSGRRLPIWIGQETAIEIALRLLGHGPRLARPLGSDLSARLVHALGGSLREVRIDRLTEGTYYAVIVVDGPQGATEVDARPSDALALALIVGAPVRADRAVVEATETDQTAAEGLAAIDSQAAVGAQALLDEITQANERQAHPSQPVLNPLGDSELGHTGATSGPQTTRSQRTIAVTTGPAHLPESAIRRRSPPPPRAPSQGGILQGRPGEWPPAAAVLGRQTDLKGAPGLIARHPRPSPHPPENQAAVS